MRPVLCGDSNRQRPDALKNEDKWPTLASLIVHLPCKLPIVVCKCGRIHGHNAIGAI